MYSKGGSIWDTKYLLSYISYISYIGEKISYNPLYEPQKPQNLLYFVTPFDNDNNNGLKRAKKQ